MNRRRSLQYGFLLGLLVSVVWFLGGEGPTARAVAEALPSFDDDPRERVLVFIVDDPRAVEGVRSAVAVERVAYATDRAVALVEGRIVAVDHEAVGDAVNAMAWLDRELELIEIPRARFETARAGGRGAEDPERREKLSALVKKERLSYAEQLIVLQAMNDGVAF